MKDEKHTIDELFKDRLYDVESAVEPASWEAITKNMQPRTVSAPKQWAYGLGAAASILLVIAYLNYNHTASPVTVLPQETQTTAIPAATPDAAVKADTGKPLQEVTENKQTEKNIPLEQIAAAEDRKSVQLPDGSEVLLNRNSSISYSTHFLSDRTVYVSGEVYFNIDAAKTKRLIIKSNLMQLDVTNASFILKSDKAAGVDEITVSTGKVEGKSFVANADRMFIFAGNSARINRKGEVRQAAIKDVNYNDWVTQKIIFNNTALDAVFEKLETYYNVSLKADNSEIMNCHFTGTFERNNIDEILQVLSVSFNLSFNQTSKEYILSGKGCR